MDRRISIPAAVLAALVVTGCQDYNFNPVGHCLIQPGTRRVTVSKISTADVLFVVDDSGSMEGEQGALGTQFPRFLDVLARVNKDRVSTDPPQEAFDFHIAVTSTSVYYNEPPANGSVCSNLCPGAMGSYVCCLKAADGSLASPQPPLCDPLASDCNTGGGFGCWDDCAGINDVNMYTSTACCNAASKAAQPIACDRPGEPCGIFDRYYYDDSICTQGNQQTGAYAAGRFLRDSTNPAPNNGTVLHFDKTLPWETWEWQDGSPPTWGGTDMALRNLATAFQKNVQIGSCGSPQEQGLEAARRAIKGVLQQDGLTQPNGTGGTIVAGTDWLHPSAKLVVVWVSDEDDCSAPYSAGDGVVFPLSSDGCVADAALPASQQRQYPVSSYADWFGSLGRDLGTAFIVSAPNGCIDGDCVPLVCTDPACTDPTPGICGGQAAPTRYLGLANTLRQRDPNASVLAGSICSPFGDSLGRLARVVKPPDGLYLPTQPADSEVTILRIVDGAGKTLRTCSRPADPAPPKAPGDVPWDETSARTYVQALTADWWFTAGEDQVTWVQRLPTASSTNIYINHATARCEATGGETYSADYIGMLPPGGCDDDSGGPSAACATVLGGRDIDWECIGHVAADPVAGTAERMGTCVCR
jgi:hypothetical protein